MKFYIFLYQNKIIFNNVQKRINKIFEGNKMNNFISNKTLKQKNKFMSERSPDQSIVASSNQNKECLAAPETCHRRRRGIQY